MRSVDTLVDLLRGRSAEQGNSLAYSFVMEDGQERSLTYAELDRQARSLAALLQATHSVGERALLLYQPGLEYLVAFFGCLYAGVVPVPAYPPRQNGNLGRLQAVVADAEATIALTSAGIYAMVTGRWVDSPGLANLRWVVTDDLVEEAALDWKAPATSNRDVAFLQYTSGSTALPKGVMLSHENLIENLKLIEKCFGTHPGSRGVIWLPPYHDMGLIGGILQPLYTGYPMTLMAPVDFVQRPVRWLETISRVGATVSGGPNFAFELCLQKITPAQREGLDLSSWELAFCGAEPIRQATLERFAEAFAPSGFRKEAFYACYGLAESTLFVSGGRKEELPIIKAYDGEQLRQDRAVEVESELGEPVKLVSSGRLSHLDHRVLVVDSKTLLPCAQRKVGEIWVSGPSVAQGYWNRAEQTVETFHATLAGSDGEERFLRTGDLGFVDAGELYVTGRLKDLIIIRGRNYYPQDVEFAVQESHVAVRNSNGAVFSVEVEGEERLVVVQEIERAHRKTDMTEVVRAIRQAVMREQQLQVYAVVLIKPVSIPKTSSGKVQRHKCKEGYLAGTLDVLFCEELGQSAEEIVAGVLGEVKGNERHRVATSKAEGNSYPLVSSNLEASSSPGVSSNLQVSPNPAVALPHAEIAAHLLTRAAHVLRVPEAMLDLQMPLAEIGLDSLMAVELRQELEEAFDVQVPLARLLDGPSLAELAAEVHALRNASLGQTLPQVEPMSTLSGLPKETTLSEGQRALWFLQKFSPDSTAYNIARAAKVSGELDADALQKAFVHLARRHPALHMEFREQDGVVYQRPCEADWNAWAYLDAESWSAAELEDRMAGEANRPFVLDRDALMRVHLFRRGAQEHVLLWTVHHLIADFWSFGVLVQELLDVYARLEAGTDVEHRAVDHGFAEHVERQQEMLSGPRGAELLRYWQDQLQGSLPVLNLPTDRTRPQKQTFRGQAITFRLPALLTTSLQHLAKQQGVTMYMMLLAAYQVLLHRYSGQDDVLVGSPTLGRARAREAHVAGYFTNPVVLRAGFSEGVTFAQFLQQVRMTVVGALEHAEYPFPLLVDHLQPQRDPSVSPLFQAMFTYQKAQVEGQEALSGFAVGQAGVEWISEALTLESMALQQFSAQFDLTLTMAEWNGELMGRLEFSTDLFAEETARRMAQHLETLLGGVVADAHQAIAELPLLADAEARQVLVDWNQTQVAYPQDVTLHELIEEQVARTPDATAVVWENEHVSYRELNRLADALADRLQALGSGPGVLVGVCMERSVELVVSLLGILKAGGAYVPLDPTLPHGRIDDMIADSQVGVVLTQERFADDLPKDRLTVLVMDAALGDGNEPGDVWALLPAKADEEASSSGVAMGRVRSKVCATDPAYMIYTSGSTGKPKGVLNSHRGIVNRLLWMQGQYELTESDCVLQKTPFGFDVSVWEFFWPLLTGARLVLAKPEGHKDSRYLTQLIQKERVTTLHFVPSMLRVFLEAEVVTDCLSVRQVMCSGEALPLELQESFFAKLPQTARLHNLYGPTEAAVDVTYWECQRDSALPFVPIGKPVANTQMYILDAKQQPVPIGVAGELHIGGVQVALGYHNRPELTAERFVPDPFGAEPSARMYKTGDLARFLPDGTIQYLGRLDHQVKLRGYRIELGEIEEVLSRHEAVGQAVALVQADKSGHSRLVAYAVTAVGAQACEPSVLRAFLKELLPEYMIPQTIVWLPEIPLSSNGKVDRKALPVPDFAASREQDYTAPATSVEARLVQIWERVLGAERIGVTDNYFELGGDSIRSLQVLAFAKKQGLSFELQDLFQHQTVRELASVVQQVEVEEQLPERAPFAWVSSKDRERLPEQVVNAYPLSKMQEGMLFHSLFQPESSLYHNVISLHVRAPYSSQAWERALISVMEKHPTLRSSFELFHYSEPLQLVHREVVLPLVEEDVRHLTADEQERVFEAWFAEEVHHHFDYAKAPLVRFHLHRRTEDTFQFSFTEHHVISDGWSIASMLTDLFQRYGALVKGEELVEEAPLQVEYCDFVALEREALASEETQTYWREYLDGATFAQVPRQVETTDVPEQQARWQTLDVAIDEAVQSQLQSLAQALRVPLKSVLLAAHGYVMSTLSGQRDLVTGLVANGRLAAEGGEHVVGLHLNSLPIRMQINGGTWGQLVQEVFAREGAMLPYRRYPLAQIQQDLGGQELFEVLFNFIHFHVYDALQTGMEMEVLSARDHIYTNFPLAVEFSVDRAERLQLRVQWDVQAFGAEFAARVIGYFLNTLQAMGADSQARYETFSMLGMSEWQQVMTEWNRTEAVYPQDVCLQELFARQVQRTPDAVALVYEKTMLSYQELDRRAEDLARHLQLLGVAPGSLVGVCLERSVEMVVALIGVVKAGGAYVPIDPTLPPERVSYLLEDSQVRVLLTQERFMQGLDLQEVSVVCLQGEGVVHGEGQFGDQVSREDNSAHSHRNQADRGADSNFQLATPTRPVTAEDPAYMIYTSGSTGLPKGVLNSHRGIVNRLLWMQEQYQLTERDRVLQKTPYSFDVSVWEFFWPLITGACLVVAKPEGHRDSRYLLELIREQEVTTLHFVPSMLQVFLEEPGIEQCESVRQVMCSGEALPYELQERYFERMPRGAKLHNLYGPTEAAVDVTYWECQPGSSLGFVPIGRPVANTQLYILDEHLQPVPFGVSGELYIGGVQVAIGYHNRPELTAERFVRDPFSAKPQARLYKTGDRARFLPDGSIQYLGRLDFQVKLRGFRIELGEIEEQMLRLLPVEQAVVVVRESTSGGELVAFYTGDQEVETGELRQTLPPYMVPTHFVRLEEMPLSPNGKGDRRVLMQMAEKLQQQPKRAYVAPKTEVQQKIAAIWAQVLGLERVGIEENFFDLGGHSILVMKVYQALRQELQFELPMTALFQYPTVRSLANAIEGGQDKQTQRKRTSSPTSLQETDIAIIGIGLRFPKANNVYEFWENLRTGRECIEHFTEEELEPSLFSMDPRNHSKLVKAGAFLEDIDRFDAEFFGISEREAQLMDPQQRVFLECAWEAIQNAGYNVDRLEGAVSLYAGASPAQYAMPGATGTSMADLYQVYLAGQPRFLATRTSYKLNLTGESLVVDTACSTSLVAVHMACQSLILGKSDYALAGGVSIAIPQKTGYLYEPNFIMSRDGHVRAYDKDASGTVSGNGSGVVFLKRLSDAMRDGDPIYAVIKGTAINNDGNVKIGYTAPSVEGQAEVIRMAQEAAQVEPDTITYVEGHGTGTQLGDPIEVAALTKAFRERTERRQYCAIGSVKTNIGHLDTAAGVAGLIKTALALKFGEIPPSLNYREPNPQIDFASTPFYVNASLQAWSSEGVRRAGVSSFGIGGTNAHAVLEEAPPAGMRQEWAARQKEGTK